ncbi:MAG: HDOD domain-containing protein [Gammaproteobacteria bacterium]|nr:HDOD domain-containing protein [Gammaproteobacteria bacterium]MDH5800921.1 HDOD domain-containing protein [Gammaproteobacteria bacterium]
MSSNMEEQITKELLDELHSDQMVLPSLPEVALKIREVLEDPDVSTQRIAEVIQTDAGLTARLIQVANSPLIRGSTRIETVESAVTRMGNSMVTNLANSLIVQQMFQPTTEVSDTKFREFWDHSAQVAAISHALSGFAKLKPDQALLAGLMHDIGMLPIIKRAEDVPELLNDNALLDRVIRNTHTAIGEAMLKKWEFPEMFVDVAAHHENVLRRHDGAADFLDLVIVANLQSYVDKDHELAKVDWETVPAFAKLGLDTSVSVVDMSEGENIQEVHDALMI